VLHTGKDFLLVDFEGDPARPLSERRLKRSPLRDVASMIRSFHYAVCTMLSAPGSGCPPPGLGRSERLSAEKPPDLASSSPGAALRPEDLAALEPWGRFWYMWVGATFLRAYFAAVAPARLFPEDSADLGILLEAFLLSRAVYEVGYELNHRPENVGTPLQGLLELIEPPPETVP
jgi:maltose alpha-D-glucosyltransferase/alpha-amylase